MRFEWDPEKDVPPLKDIGSLIPAGEKHIGAYEDTDGL